MERLERAKAPDRTINKQQATRHLLHAAIRMQIHIEDPLAIHMLLQSADKLLIDVAKKTGKELKFNIEDCLVPDKEKRKLFFGAYREVYNYLKHAESDFDQELGVRHICDANLLMAFHCVVNYQELYGSITQHMQIPLRFVQLAWPSLFDLPEPLKQQHDGMIKTFEDRTPKELFDILRQIPTRFFPDFEKERAEDQVDNEPFMATSFADIWKQQEQKQVPQPAQPLSVIPSGKATP